AISRLGDRLAYSHIVTDFNIWRAPAKNGAEGAAAAVIASTLADVSARYSPDGKQIVFSSNRSGRPEIWIAGADGSNPIQITSRWAIGPPSWSPDGQKIAFDWRAGGKPEIYAVPLSGGKPMALTNSSSENVCPNYSRDGKWIYFASNRGGRFE